MRYDEDGVMKLPLLRPQVQNLSGGELQRVALTLCLGKPADVYLIDEPSAYLDSEQRLMAARVIKRYALLSLLLKQLPFLMFILKHKRQRIHSEQLKTQDFFSVLLWYKVRRERVLIIIFQVISSFQLHSWSLWVALHDLQLNSIFVLCYLNG